VRDVSEGTWWRKTWQVAAAVTAGTIVLSLALLLLMNPLDGQLVFGVPLGTFVAVVLAPLAVLLVTCVFSAQQRALDRRYDVAED
jgi:putative solute:sodium symporter small subunit